MCLGALVDDVEIAGGVGLDAERMRSPEWNYGVGGNFGLDLSDADLEDGYRMRGAAGRRLAWVPFEAPSEPGSERGS